MAAARAVFAVAALCAPSHAYVWSNVGGDPMRTSTVSVSLPSASTGFDLSAVSAGGGVPLIGSPLVTCDDVVVLPFANCSLSFLGPDMKLLSQWSGCVTPSDVLSTPASLSSTGDMVVLVTSSSAAYGVSTGRCGAATAPRGYLWQDITLPGTQVWGPVTWAPACVSPLVIGGVVWTASTALPIIIQADARTGVLLSSMNITCAGVPDVIAAPLTQAAQGGDPAVLALTSRGCVMALNRDGTVAWSAANASSNVFVGGITAPISVSMPTSQLFFVSRDGHVCCISTLQHTACSGWGTACVVLGANAGVAGGLVVSPASAGFQFGQVFAVDASGTEYAVLMADGTIAMSAPSELLIDGTAATPVLVPNGLGQELNALLVASTTGYMYAIYVGDAPTSSDDTDSSTDDAFGNTGLAWSMFLLSNNSGTTVNISAAGFAVRDDGVILVGASDGSVYALRAAHAAPAPASDVLIAVVVSICGVIIVAATGAVMYCAWNRRRMLAEERRAEASSMATALLDRPRKGSDDMPLRGTLGMRGAVGNTSLDALDVLPVAAAAPSVGVQATWMPPRAPVAPGPMSRAPVRVGVSLNGTGAVAHTVSMRQISSLVDLEGAVAAAVATESSSHSRDFEETGSPTNSRA